MKIFNKRKNYSNEIDIYVAQLLFEYNTATDAESRNTIVARLKKHIHENNFPHDPRLKCELGRFLYLEMISDNEEWIAITLFDQAAERRNIDAKHLLCQAIATHRKYAKKGVLISQSLLGRYLALKDSSSVEAGMWLKEAADKDDPESEHFLSICYLSGLCGLEEDKVKAKDYAQRAVDHGNWEAAFNLGCFYADGIGCKKDIEKAKKYLKIAKDMKHPYAQKELDNLYSEEKTQSNPDVILIALEALTRKVENMDQNNAQGFKEVEKIVIDSKNELKQGQEELKKLVDAIPEKTKKLIFSKLDEVTRANAEFIECFEQMHKQLEKGLSDIQWTVNETKYNIETLSSKMQEFFDKMDKECKIQATSPECRSLRETCETELSLLFGVYWTNGQLLESTKESLIAARVLLACAEREGLYDCRGIVISATSALERELKARFYTGVRQYFIKQGIWNENTGDNLPQKLRQKITPNGKEDDFTLGNVKYILWVDHYRTDDKNEIIYDYSDEYKKSLREYLKKCIISPEILSGEYKYNNQDYNEDNPEYIFTNRGNGYTKIITLVADTYRNPAAHTKETDFNVAKACCKDVIGISRADLENIESCLLDLLKLTKKYKHNISDT